jgi:hypothetical protein
MVFGVALVDVMVVCAALVGMTFLLTGARVVVVTTELRVVIDAGISTEDSPEAAPQPARMTSASTVLAAWARREFARRVVVRSARCAIGTLRTSVRA